MKVIIVGGGVMGLATARGLVKAGHAVTVLEQGSIPNHRGSSVDQHRIIRYAYGSAHEYGRMIPDAYAAWERLWRDLGTRHYVEAGHLMVGDRDDPWIRDSLLTLDEFRVPYEEVQARAFAERFPMVAAERGVHTPVGGALLAERIVADLARWLHARGADLREHSRVAAVHPAEPRVELANGAALTADAVLVAAGPWIDRLVPALRGAAVPSRQAVVYVQAPRAYKAAWASAPVLSDTRGGTIFFALPPVAGTELKVGDHHFSREGNADDPREARQAEVEAVMRLAGERLRDGAAYRVTRPTSCFYTVTEDERFTAIEEGAMLALSPCSGHGFKFAALIGERAAQALDGCTSFAAFARWLGGGGG